jgi:hypothetical protein
MWCIVKNNYCTAVLPFLPLQRNQFYRHTQRRNALMEAHYSILFTCQFLSNEHFYTDVFQQLRC